MTATKIIAVGDFQGGTGSAIATLIGTYYADTNTKMLLTMGDHVYQGGAPADWTTSPKFLADGKVVRSGSQWIYPTTGHHDWGNSGVSGTVGSLSGATVHSPADGLKPYFDGVQGGLAYGDGLWYYHHDITASNWRVIHLSCTVKPSGAPGPVGTVGHPLVPVGGSFITTKAISGNVATLTTSATAHGLLVGDVVTVACSPADAVFDGTHTLTAVTGTSVQFALTHAPVASTATAGTVGTAQWDWFKNRLIEAVANNYYVLALWSDPFYGTTDNHHSAEPLGKPFWDLLRHYVPNRAVVLNGHKHNYERFDMMDGSVAGAVDTTNGIHSFVVGTANSVGYSFTGTTAPGSLFKTSTTFGVLEVTLDGNTFTHAMKTVAPTNTVDSNTITLNPYSVVPKQINIHHAEFDLPHLTSIHVHYAKIDLLDLVTTQYLNVHYAKMLLFGGAHNINIHYARFYVTGQHQINVHYAVLQMGATKKINVHYAALYLQFTPRINVLWAGFSTPGAPEAVVFYIKNGSWLPTQTFQLKNGTWV